MVDLKKSPHPYLLYEAIFRIKLVVRLSNICFVLTVYVKNGITIIVCNNILSFGSHMKPTNLHSMTLNEIYF